MSRWLRRIEERSAGREFLAFENVSVRLGEAAVFQNTNWTWRAGEQWAMLGPDGSGKALLGSNGAGKTTLLNLIQGDHPQAYALDIRLFGRRTDSTQTL